MSEPARDPVARRLAVVALGLGLMALVLGGYAVNLGLRYLEDVRTLGDALGRRQAETPVEELDLVAPPPPLAD